MPSGTPVTERQRRIILELICDERATFAEIAHRAECCERTVAIVLRRYARLCWERERSAERLDDLRDREP